jgi:hypothetical protein
VNGVCSHLRAKRGDGIRGSALLRRVPGKSCARKALPASVAESRSIARREVGFRKEFEDIVSPFDLR